MQFYLAPLEGITGYIYRNAFHNYFDTICSDGEQKNLIDKYYAPFISPGNNKKLTSKEKNDILPNHNRDIFLVPQVLTNDAGCFVRMAGHLRELGYTEVNLNLGCPSGTVVAKHKGAGFLQDIGRLDAFLQAIYDEVEIDISIKTRIGFEDIDEWSMLLDIFNRYPVKELIVHPRLRQDQYKGRVRMEQFAYTMEHAKMPVCYNGDIFRLSDYYAVKEAFPELESVMLGRGLLRNPALVREIFHGQKITQEEFMVFHNTIFHAYEEIMSGERNLLFKMKELWNYWIYLFDNREEIMKKIRRIESKQEYMMFVSRIIKERG